MAYNPRWIKNTEVVKRDGTNTLTDDWNIGDQKKIILDELRIQDNDGLTISDTSGIIVFYIEDDTGNVTIPNGDLTVGTNDYTYLGSDGTIDLVRSTSNGYINFKTSSVEDFDCRIIQDSDGLEFHTGGTGNTAVGLRIESDRDVNIPNGVLNVLRPSDSWSQNSHFSIENLGFLYTGGSYGVSLTSNAYRNSSSGMSFLGANSITDAGTTIDLYPEGKMLLRGGTYVSGTSLPIIMDVQPNSFDLITNGDYSLRVDANRDLSIFGDVSISGDLFVDGTTTTINTVNLDVEDNMITVNSGEPGAGVTAGVAGIKVDRGTSTDYVIEFNETQDNFRVGEIGSEQAVATREDSPTNGYVPVWNDTSKQFDTSIGIDATTILTTADEGSGNGLDADTVDGIEASQFVRTDITSQIASNVDLELGSGEGALRFRYNSSINKGSITPYDGGDWDTNKQIIFDSGAGEWDIEGSPNAGGNRILTTADEGTGNGLDADTVDGIEASQFVRNDQNNQVIEGNNDASPFAVKRLNATNHQVSIELLTSDVGETTTYQGFLGIHDGVLKFGPDANLSSNGLRILNTGDEGTGNGLDADTVDGIEASQFMRSDQNTSTTGNITITNSAPQLILNESTDTDNEWTFVADSNNFSLRYPDLGGTSFPIKVITSSGVATEVKVFDSRVLTEADEGSGNGLDADTVDGLEASQFLRSDQADSMSGDLTIGSGDDQVLLDNAGLIVLSDSAGYASVSFKDQETDSYDARVGANGSNGLRLQTGGNGSTATAIEIDSDQNVSMPNGDLTVGSSNDKIELIPSQGIEITKSDAAGYIDFKSAAAEDFDCRIQQSTNGLLFRVGGNGSIITGLSITSAGYVTIPSNDLRVGTGDEYVYCNNGGHLDICTASGNASVDFKTSDAEDYDCRIEQSSNGLHITTGGGDGSASLAMDIDSNQNVDIPNGRISSNHVTISSNQTNLDVSNINSIFAVSSSGDITLSGLTGGIVGQIIYIVKTTSANNLIMEHNEGDGDQEIFTPDASDITLSTYGGATLVCNGTNWFIASTT